MKNAIAILLMMISIQANAFNYLLKDKNIEKPNVSLNIQQQIVGDEMSVGDFLKLKEIVSTTTNYKIKSYEIFVSPTQGYEPFEFGVSQNNSDVFQKFIKDYHLYFQQGAKVYFDNVIAIDENGNEINLGSIVFKLK